MKKIVVRAANANDVPFILSTWLRGLRYGNDWFALIDKDAYFTKYAVVVDNLLRNSYVSVACLASDPEVIVGYIVYDVGVLHWVYVKKAWRRLGLAKQLVPYNPIERITHLTKLGQRLMPEHWRFDPFL